ncbi:tripartite tricarboxylate transporter TctB family protein [Glutamicibacter sp. NPDC087344]|uniref:tripartite tricarboxylate transporter TctB family protein n=1 Tax=Glutamicibacter sp. NPDC087344 TaxID=3363994 RepID=UPI0038118B53
MSENQIRDEAQEPSSAVSDKRPVGALIVSAVLLVFGVFALQQAASMKIIGDSMPGPDFFPYVIGVLLLLTAVLLSLQWFRSSAEDHPQESRTTMDWISLGGAVASFVGFILLLEPLGWLICASALFWFMSFSLGGKKHLSNAAIAVLFAAITQIIFSMGLGINLPAGILGGLS